MSNVFTMKPGKGRPTGGRKAQHAVGTLLPKGTQDATVEGGHESVRNASRHANYWGEGNVDPGPTHQRGRVKQERDAEHDRSMARLDEMMRG